MIIIIKLAFHPKSWNSTAKTNHIPELYILNQSYSQQVVIPALYLEGFSREFLDLVLVLVPGFR